MGFEKVLANSLESIDGLNKSNSEKCEVKLKENDASMGNNEIKEINEINNAPQKVEINEEKYLEIMGEREIDNIEDYNRTSKNWPESIIENMSSLEEYKIYEKADLCVDNVEGKDCLVRSDIDWSKKDFMGRSNTERIEQGLSPIGSNGRPIELHHIGQHSDSPFAELTMEEHRGKGNDTILHNKLKESEIDRQEFAVERSEYWSNRVKGAA